MATVHFGLMDGAGGFSRVVAIKRLHPELLDDPSYVAMLLDEARIAGRVRHANVVPIVDVVDDAGEPLIVLEYVHGLSLSHVQRLLLERGEKIPESIVAAIAVDALRGLAAAHGAVDARGVSLELVHRDISPQNLLVDTSGVTKVVDFGIAKAAGRAQPTTQTGALKGKIGYLAPEQIHNNVSARSDLFALGTVLWELLAGERLFVGATDGAVLAATLGKVVGPPSALRGEGPSPLDAVILRSLERRPSERYASADAMAEAVLQAVAVAPHDEVARWLGRVGAEVLDGRTALLRELEALGPGHAHAASPSVAAAAVTALPPTTERTPPERGAGPAATLAPTLISSGVAPAEASMTPSPKRRRRRLAAVLVAGLAPLAAWALWPSEPTGAAAPSSTTRTLAPTPEPSVDASPPPAERSAVVVASAPQAPTVSTDGGAPVTRPTNAPRRRPPAKSVTKSGATPGQRPDCTTPFVINADGVKAWRRECFGESTPR